MRKLLCKWFKLVPREEHIRLYNEYLRLTGEFMLTIDKYNMQNQWQQVKQDRERARVH